MDDEQQFRSGQVAIGIGLVTTLLLVGCYMSGDAPLGDVGLLFRALARSAPRALAAVALIAAIYLIRTRVRISSRLVVSLIPHHQGLCHPVWINRDSFDAHAPDACTGVFRRARRLGKLPILWLERDEFHGALQGDEVITVLALLSSRTLPMCRSSDAEWR